MTTTAYSHLADAQASEFEQSALFLDLKNRTHEHLLSRIEELGATAPELLVGHHYTRYLGDLSGGQILSTIASRAMNLTDDQGLAFYRFEAIDDEKAFKDTYRAALDALPVDQAMADRIVAEANEAFHLNMLMFQELEGNLVAAIGKVLFGFLTRRQRQGSTEAVVAA